jgi:ankyrin repeat protein
MAATGCQKDIVDELIKKGANISVKNQDGKTACDIATIKCATFCQHPEHRNTEQAEALKNIKNYLRKASENPE